VNPVTEANLHEFLRRLGQRVPPGSVLHLLGGSALCLLGSPRTTVDIDYTVEPFEGIPEHFEPVVADLAAEMDLDVEAVPIAEFVPIPPGAGDREQLVGRYGRLTAYIFDPYTIALSRIARGFEADLEDVLFLLRSGIIDFSALERHFRTVLPDAPRAEIFPDEFRRYFDEVRRRFGA